MGRAFRRHTGVGGDEAAEDAWLPADTFDRCGTAVTGPGAHDACVSRGGPITTQPLPNRLDCPFGHSLTNPYPQAIWLGVG